MMLSEKMLTVVMRSILRDRNAEKAKILNKQETEKHVILKLKDRSDEITIKSLTEESEDDDEAGDNDELEETEEESEESEEEEEAETVEEATEEEKKAIILNFIEEKGEFVYKAGEIAEVTGIEPADCTRITLDFLKFFEC